MTIAATIELHDAASVVWDALVIGAGPAGALAAQQLARGGARVLLVDRQAFPRAKVCGGCVNERAMSLLRSCGLDDVARALPGQPLTDFHVVSRGRTCRFPLSGGRAVSRAVLDAGLVHAAIAAGADFLPETTALVEPEGCDDDDAARRVELRGQRQDPEGHGVDVASRVVLAADGLAGASVQRLPQMECHVSPASRIGLGAIVGDAPPSFAPGVVYMAVGKHGYVGLVRIEQGALNVAAAVDAQLVKQSGGPGRAVAALIAEAGLPAIDLWAPEPSA